MDKKTLFDQKKMDKKTSRSIRQVLSKQIMSHLHVNFLNFREKSKFYKPNQPI